MLLCDVGNSYAHFFNGEKYWYESLNDFIENHKKDSVYYINVNEKVKDYLKNLKNWTDLEKYIKFDTKYSGMGIDRKVACLAIEDGVVVDAGSAITVDLMIDKKHIGGFIMPGFKSIEKAFKSISVKLDKKIDFDIDIEKIPLNTEDAISYGAIKPAVLAIKDFAKDKKIYLTGGDGEKLYKFLNNSVYDKNLIFKGMIKVIKEIS